MRKINKKGERESAKIESIRGYYTSEIASDVSLCPEQLVAALYTSEKGIRLSLFLLSAPQKVKGNTSSEHATRQSHQARRVTFRTSLSGLSTAIV